MKILKLGQMIGGANSPKPSGLLNEYSINFDGANDNVDCGDSNDFSFGNGTTDSAFSISAWINASSLTLERPIVAKNFSAQQEYTFKVLTNGALQFSLYDTLGPNADHATIQSASAGTITTGSWFHVVASYAGGGVSGMGMFVNGSALSTSASTNNYTAMSNGLADFLIGKDEVARKIFSGNIDEVSLWDKKLDLSDASSLYNSGTPTDLTGMSNLVGWWRMGDPLGTGVYPTIVDQSTNSNNGTMTNMTSSDIETVVP
tara:strand:- start:366 stop:1142 length:777 start_codon:yes stop_codon:yes gene_type:complete